MRLVRPRLLEERSDLVEPLDVSLGKGTVACGYALAQDMIRREDVMMTNLRPQPLGQITDVISR